MCLCGYYVLDAFVSHYFRSRFSLCPIMKEVFKDRFLNFVDHEDIGVFTQERLPQRGPYCNKFNFSALRIFEMSVCSDDDGIGVVKWLRECSTAPRPYCNIFPWRLKPETLGCRRCQLHKIEHTARGLAANFFPAGFLYFSEEILPPCDRNLKV